MFMGELLDLRDIICPRAIARCILLPRQGLLLPDNVLLKVLCHICIVWRSQINAHFDALIAIHRANCSCTRQRALFASWKYYSLLRYLVRHSILSFVKYVDLAVNMYASEGCLPIGWCPPPETPPL